ncbi:interleukin-1 receptor type 2 [Brachionichthys hirsutus]|uniref:interleukin-1 receptor type 2 n=1 Tax=Brachionichthys hirsutus TaxID=412623 RepID=UPI003604BC5A
MALLGLILAVGIIDYAYGRPPLPSLPMRGGCYLVNPEVGVFRVEGEPVVLSFPMFQSVLRARRIAPPRANYVITGPNGTGDVPYLGEGRVQQRHKQLWLLPAEASDSGRYVCSYSNETYCVTGSIQLHVYPSNAVDTKTLSYPISATVGEKLEFKCPSISYFNKTGRLIEWYKISSPTGLRLVSFPQNNGPLLIPIVKRSHAGAYTCLLRVLIQNQQYEVSRSIQLRVKGLDPADGTAPDPSVTSDPGRISSLSAPQTPVILPPVIVSPLNGTFYEILHGSVLELFCEVITGCPMAESTVVTWTVNGQSVESSYLNGRALQGERRVTRLPEGCRVELKLLVVKVTVEDVETRLKCVAQNRGGRREVVTRLRLEDSTSTWLALAGVAALCFLAVVSIFLYVLFRPKGKRKMDYMLARQNSAF